MPCDKEYIIKLQVNRQYTFDNFLSYKITKTPCSLLQSVINFLFLAFTSLPIIGLRVTLYTNWFVLKPLLLGQSHWCLLCLPLALQNKKKVPWSKGHESIRPYYSLHNRVLPQVADISSKRGRWRNTCWNVGNLPTL
jgi:hypothetical protein